MAKEAETILRAALYQVMIAKSKAEAEIAVKAMCSKDDIAAVLERVAEYNLLNPNNEA